MHQSHVLSALLVGFVLGTPACGSKFVSLGEQDAGSGGGAMFSAGGTSAILGAGGSDGCVCDDPTPLEQICVDGSIKTPFCARDPSGACGWFSEACPVTGAGGSGSPGQGLGGSNGCFCSGPAPDVASQWCPDGTLAGPACEPDASGVCSWRVHGCPNNGAGGANAGVGGAMPAEGGAMPAAGGAVPAEGGAIAAVGGSSGCVCTGPAPKMMNYLCSDGSMAGPICEPDASSGCSWQIRDCVDGAGGAASMGGAAAFGGNTGSTCQYNGAVYGEGQSFPSIDGCNTCYCMPAGVACTKMACVVGMGGASSVPNSDPSCPLSDAVPNCTNGAELVLDPTTGCSRYVCL